MKLSITVGAPKEGGDSQPIDRFAFEGLLSHTRVYVCACIVLCLSQVARATQRPGH